jgi:hypothetical protein
MLLIQKHFLCDPELIKREYWTTRIAEYIGIFVLLVILLKA